MSTALLSLVLLGATAHGAEVPEPACSAEPFTAAELAGLLGEAEVAFDELDAEGFERSTLEIQTTLPCLEEVVAPSLAARIHRFEGLRGFMLREQQTAELAFAASRRVEPSYLLNDSVSPKVRSAFEAFDPAGISLEAWPLPAETDLFIDGARVLERPVEVPVLVQFVEGGDHAVQTLYFWPGDTRPDYEQRPAELPLGDVQRPLPVGGLATGGGMLVASGVLYGLAWVTRGTYDDPATDLADVDALRSRIAMLSIGSGVLAAGGAGVGVVSLLRKK